MLKLAAFLSFLYCLFIYILLNWSSFDDCYAPIQISLLAATSLILSRYILKCFVFVLSNSCIKTFMTLFIIWAIPVLLVITVVVGIVWLCENLQYTDTCGSELLPPDVIIGIMTMAFFTNLYFIYKSIIECFEWNSMRRNHHRIRQDLENNFDVDAYVIIPDESIIDKLNDAQLQKLEVKKCRKSFSMLEVCAICSNEYQEGEELLFVPGCTHHYHSNCVKVWFKMKATCPTCRNDISKYLPGMSV